MNQGTKTKRLQEINDSLTNGQFQQLVDQIKAYGVTKFHIDYMNFVIDRFPNAMAKYASVVYKYHKLKDRYS